MVEANPRKKFFAKIVPLGDVNVGKTTLIKQFTSGQVSNPSVTIGTDFMTKQMNVKGKDVSIQLWDTAGQEKHSSLGFAFYRGANICVLCFDLTSAESFGRLDYWKRNFLDQASPPNPATFPFLVIGNKSDGERAVTRMQADEWCTAAGYEYFETNAISGEGVEAAFKRAAEIAMDQQPAQDDDAGLPTSLFAAQGAIKIDANTEAEAEDQKKKKKKKCKC